MWFQSSDFWKDPPLYFMGEAVRILYYQTFLVGAWNIWAYQSEDQGLRLICYAWHVPAFTEMISILLAGKII